MKASSKRNHFDVITSKCRPDRHHCVGQVSYRYLAAANYMPPLTTAYHFVVNLQQIAMQRDTYIPWPGAEEVGPD